MSPHWQVAFVASNFKIATLAGWANALVYLVNLFSLTLNSYDLVAPIIYISQYYDRFYNYPKLFLLQLEINGRTIKIHR